MTRVYVFGNPDLAADALPLKLLPKLRERLPHITFTILDPNEEWEIADHITILDTVIGIRAVTVFTDLSAFARTPRATLHDFDALTNLRLLQKLGKLKAMQIIGVPPTIAEDQALAHIVTLLNPNSR